MNESTFATRYDELMAQPWVVAFYEGSGYFNTGYWDGVTRSQRDACDRLVQEVTRSLPAGFPAALLEAGCGFGATTRALCRQFPAAAITGVNLSAWQIGICREQLSAATFEVMDAAALQFADGSFDAVVSIEAAFHFDTREAFLREAARCLREGGRLALSDILVRDPGVAGDWMVPTANRIATLDEYRDSLARAGFVDLELRDATEQCWRAFCRNLRHRQVVPESFLARLEESVALYVLVTATRGSS